MKLAAKPDLAEVLARFEAWCECRPLDRPLVTIYEEPARPPKMPEKRHGSLRERWMDADYVLDCVEARVESGVFLAETFPTYMPFLGPEVCATLFGAELKFKNEETSYSVPVARSVRDILGTAPDFSGEYWEKIRQLTDLSLERGRGRWITGVTDLHTNGDLVAALRDRDAAVDRRAGHRRSGGRRRRPLYPGTRLRRHQRSRPAVGGASDPPGPGKPFPADPRLHPPRDDRQDANRSRQAVAHRDRPSHADDRRPSGFPPCGIHEYGFQEPHGVVAAAVPGEDAGVAYNWPCAIPKDTGPRHSANFAWPRILSRREVREVDASIRIASCQGAGSSFNGREAELGVGHHVSGFGNIAGEGIV